MKEFDVLNSDLEANSRLFIEAAAGTGKTFTIEHLVARLIIEKDFHLDQILVVTFTKAGTRELRARIHKNLLKILDILGKGSFKEISYLNNCDPAVAKFRLQQALALIEEANIHTIHSFCFEMLSRFAFDAHIEAPKEEDQERYTSLKTIILDTLRTLDSREFSPNQLQIFTDSAKRDLPRTIMQFANLLESNPKFQTFTSYTELEKEFQSCSIPDNLSETLFKLLPKYKKTTNRQRELLPALQKQIDSICTKDFESLIKATPSIFSLISPENLKKGMNHTPPECIAKLSPLVLEASSKEVIFLRIATKIQKRLIQEDFTNPDQILEKMLHSLSRKPFFEKVQGLFSAAIIDEFQDTDPVQWKIFAPLFLDKELFALVGDPKQSIYAFRGANLKTYLQAKQAFSDTCYLSTNYRSSPSLIDVLNKLFLNVKGLFAFDDLTQNIEYFPVTAGLPTSSENSGLKFCLSENETEMFSHIAQEIVTLNDFKRSGICILVKDRYQGRRIAEFLEKKGITTTTSATSSLLETKAFTFFKAFVQLLHKPKDLNLLKQLLMDEPLKVDHIHLINDQYLEKSLVAMCEISEVFENLGFAKAIHKFMETTFTDRKVHHHIIEDPEIHSDFTQILSMLLHHAPENPAEFLTNLEFKNVDSHPFLRRNPMVESDSVQIMTTHMSKGLEFDVVFSIGTAQRTLGAKKFVQSETNDCLIFNANNKECRAIIHEQDKEKIRLLYVAMTRAKSRLYLYYLKPERALKLGAAAPIELYLARLGKETLSVEQTYEAIDTLDFGEIEKRLKSVGISPTRFKPELQPEKQEEKNVELIAPLDLKINEEPTYYQSFSQLSTHTSVESGLQEEVIVKEGDLPKGPKTGNAIHLILEKLLESGQYRNFNEKEIRNIIQKEICFTDLQPFEDRIYQIIHTAFHTPLDGFTLKEVPPENILQEMLFQNKVNKNTIIKGFIDLVFHYNNTYYILDWKLNCLPAYTPAHLHAAMQTHDYYLQASIYQSALKKHLEALINSDNSSTYAGPSPTLGKTYYFFLRGNTEGLLSL